MKKNGFTLVELLIVIVIIGILAAMVLPRIFGPTEQSRSTEARNMLGTIRQLEEAFRNGPSGTYMAINSNPPNCDDQVAISDYLRLGITNPNLVGNTYFTYCVDNVSATTFRVVASRTNLALSQGVNAGDMLCLNQDGMWSGTYIHTPGNPGGVFCTNTLGPCC